MDWEVDARACVAKLRAGRLVFDYTVLEVLDERMAALKLVAYVPPPGTGTREKLVKLLEASESLLIVEGASAPS